VAVSGGGYHSVALRTDGSLVAWGNDDVGQVTNTPTGTGFVAISAGDTYHNVALRSDGSLVSWGNDVSGQVSNTPSGTGFVAVSAGGGFSVALRSDGSLVSWGQDDDDQVTNTPAGTNFVAVSAGLFHAVALRTDGSLVAWGQDILSQVSNTPTGNHFVAVAAGWEHNVAIRSATPAEEVSDLKSTLSGLGLASGTTKSLEAKLNSALAALEAGNTAGACAALAAFINEVNAQAGKKISASDAAALIAEATVIMGQIGC
jgi:alpha-tubulin suppressor-like RCC1 family protein